MGYRVFMDGNGDAEGNYTLLALAKENGLNDSKIGPSEK
jgi:hypothetical protein